ncbi:MAG: hypothetical protein WC428_06540 [Candidatus Paceibacterota bacterium]|jgi:hypothetical protein
MILKSRKFWLMVFDVVLSTATYFIGQYVSPEVGNNILWLIGAWQPVIVSLIVGIAVEDAAEKGNAAYFEVGE